MDLTSFSHGQIHSKLWLCEKLEPYIPPHATIGILGAWYNVLGFMLMVRNPKRYTSIIGLDIDPNVKSIADKICEAWTIQPTVKVFNRTQDVNTSDYNGYHVIINCSVEHMANMNWFHKIPKNTVVCLQSAGTNDFTKIEEWKITNPNHTFEEFKEKYPLSHYYLRDEIKITYDDWWYSRYMTIGIK